MRWRLLPTETVEIQTQPLVLSLDIKSIVWSILLHKTILPVLFFFLCLVLQITLCFVEIALCQHGKTNNMPLIKILCLPALISVLGWIFLPSLFSCDLNGQIIEPIVHDQSKNTEGKKKVVCSLKTELWVILDHRQQWALDYVLFSLWPLSLDYSEGVCCCLGSSSSQTAFCCYPHKLLSCCLWKTANICVRGTSGLPDRPSSGLVCQPLRGLTAAGPL